MIKKVLIPVKESVNNTTSRKQSTLQIYVSNPTLNQQKKTPRTNKMRPKTAKIATNLHVLPAMIQVNHESVAQNGGEENSQSHVHLGKEGKMSKQLKEIWGIPFIKMTPINNMKFDVSFYWMSKILFFSNEIQYSLT